ncbi:nucleotidyltransferase family protein [Tenacibaculum jejuense]|uniref:Nucleotidyl transferase n=1 Tax=Tenacibaculum jejuense TaxID=584609 RepID=A0A238U763_9FLAO|nr:nucleotidyltransferase family protein [Tenacibaculum jejuense]SNR14895.1 Nucleotidyl transferase [Tenacibaculum jejuense]
MRNFKEHLLPHSSIIKEALSKLNLLGKDAILFIIDEENKLKGSLTDGDVRRGLLKGVTINDTVTKIIQENPKYIKKGEYDINKIIEYRENNYRILPVIDRNNEVVNVINFRLLRSYLPVDAIIMAGGRGSRLMPLTDNTPKPLLKVGEKPIMEHNVDRLALYGIDDYWFSVKYLGEQIEEFFGNGEEKNLDINYIWEDKPMGTIGAVSKIQDFKHDYILLTNSDILTNLDYEHFYLDFIKKDADFSVVSIPYQVNIPYAVLENEDGVIKSFKEKPTYTYYSNGGIYLMKKEVLDFIPKEEFFNATDLMERLIEEKRKVISYPLAGYWLDVGKHEDFKQAQEDINKIKF